MPHASCLMPNINIADDRFHSLKIMSFCWDYCIFNGVQSAALKELELSLNEQNNLCATESLVPTHVSTASGKFFSNSVNGTDIRNTTGVEIEGVDGLQSSLLGAEVSIRIFVSELDRVLSTLGEIASLHDDVTGRTNSLMSNCENLLEQQVI